MQTPQETFELFATPHLATLALIAAAALVIPVAVRHTAPGAVRPVGYALALLLVGQELLQTVIVIQAGEPPVVAVLPLHLCNLAVYLTAWVLVTRGPRTYEVVYFWGLGGTVQALLTPDLQQAFPHPHYLFFFLGHGLVIVGVLYATLALRLRPYLASIPRVAAITLAYAVVIFAVNLWLDTNFLYLMAKPEQASILDWSGPWPWYLPALILLGFASLVIWYLPFLVADLIRTRSK